VIENRRRSIQSASLARPYPALVEEPMKSRNRTGGRNANAPAKGASGGRQPVRNDPLKHASLQPAWFRNELLHLLSLSGTLAGLCITGVALFITIGKSSIPSTVADDMLALSAVLFLICTYTIFFALRTRKPEIAILLEKSIDIVFSLALAGMVAAGFIMVYTIW
jgi:hypothetical protein